MENLDDSSILKDKKPDKPKKEKLEVKVGKILAKFSANVSNLRKEKTVDLVKIKSITIPADFYAWKKHIVAGLIAEGEEKYAKDIEGYIVYPFYLEKDTIIRKLNI